MQIYTALVHPIGEDHDASSVLVAKTQDELHTKVLSVLNSWGKPQRMEGDTDEDWPEPPEPEWTTLDEAFAEEPNMFVVLYDEHTL